MLDFIVFIHAFVSCVSLQFILVDLLVNFLGLFTLSMFMLFCIPVYYSATFSVLV